MYKDTIMITTKYNMSILLLETSGIRTHKACFFFLVATAQHIVEKMTSTQDFILISLLSNEDSSRPAQM